MKNVLGARHSYMFDRSGTLVLFRSLGLVILNILLCLLHRLRDGSADICEERTGDVQLRIWSCVH
jgi:hypothetical protein